MCEYSSDGLWWWSTNGLSLPALQNMAVKCWGASICPPNLLVVVLQQITMQIAFATQSSFHVLTDNHTATPALHKFYTTHQMPRTCTTFTPALPLYTEIQPFTPFVQPGQGIRHEKGQA
jgi:hypothetical protein